MKTKRNILESRLLKRADGIKTWLEKNGDGCFKKQGHLEANTIERIYWHYGYRVALLDVLSLIRKSKIEEN